MGSHYENGVNDFSITVVSQNINLREKPESPSRRKPKGPLVPQIKGIDGVRDTASSINAVNNTALTMRNVPIHRDHITNANKTPDSVEHDRMVPAPMISGREGLIDSSKDDCGSSPSRHFASIDQN